MIPHLLPELSDPQRTALEYAEKVPLCIVNVALRDWRALAASGMSGFYAPGGFLCYGGMDFPVSMGDYAFTANPEDPAVLQFWHAPAAGPIGGEPKARFRDGRRSLYERTFESFEQAVFAELDRAWGRHGLDPGRDVAALTVNRWPHGYAYEYMDLWDDAAWGRGAGPHVIGRQQVGRIAIANSDSEQYAYVNGAIDAAYRAVRELTT
jgi:spermidine dehydrogenase